MADKKAKPGAPRTGAGRLEVTIVDNISGHLHPDMEPGEAIVHITRELKGFLQFLGKDRLKELIDILDGEERKPERAKDTEDLRGTLINPS